MDWHQPWLMAVPQEELEALLDDCRQRSKAHRRAGRFGLAVAWEGLGHEVLERARELDDQESAAGVIRGQLSLVHPGAYGAYAAHDDGGSPAA